MTITKIFRLSQQARLWLALTLLSSLASIAAAAPSQPAIKWNAGKQGKFITALCEDHHGNIWVGTEDKGVWEYHTRTQHWQQFTVSSTGGTPSKLGPVLTAGTPNEHALGDNDIYAIACDRLGRIWVGHLNHGVSVYNGKSWRNYDVINGPLGERVFDIATCPVNGDVWIATDEGLTRYSLKNDSWSYYTEGTKGKGLPSNQIQAIAFAKDGTLYAATQCHGLAICKPTKDYQTNQLVYRKWRTVKSRFVNRPPLTPMGNGLPTNLLNDVMVAHDGTVWVATDEGLAWSRNKGQSWQFVRGRDWEAKDKGLYHGPSDHEIDQMASNFHRWNLLLAEDYVTCVGEDDHGYIWIGHWRKGVEVLDPKTGKHYQSNGKRIISKPPSSKTKRVTAAKAPVHPRDYVSSMFPLPGQPPIVGFYGSGLIQMPQRFHVRHSSTRAYVDDVAESEGTHRMATLPSPAAPPTTSSLKAMIKQIDTLRSPVPPVWAGYLHDDWMTWGDWFGRYGRKFTVLCAGSGPLDDHVCYGSRIYNVVGRIGPNHRKDDALRRWVATLYSHRLQILYDPTLGYRRQASWDDHGETYPFEHAGPGLWIRVTVPAGIDSATLYFVNKDGHTGNNRFRDYLIQVFPYVSNISRLHNVRPLAKARVRQFWFGVYKTFALHGSNQYLIHIARNYSFNTIVSAVMLTKKAGPHNRLDDMALPWTGWRGYKPPTVPKRATLKTDTATLAQSIRRRLHNKCRYIGCAEQRCPDLLLADRALATHHADNSLRSNWRWMVHLWTPEDRREFQSRTAQLWQYMLKINPALANRTLRKKHR